MKNCILITVDSLRYDTLFENEQLATRLKRCLDESVSFSQAFTTGPGTTPSFPAILTGTLPLSYGGLGPLTNERPRVASELSEAGLSTGGFHSNPFLSEHFNYEVGFDTFEDYQNPLMGVATKIFPRGIEINNPKFKQIDKLLNITDGIKKVYSLLNGKPRPYVSANIIVDDTIKWIDETNDRFFCWSHFMDVHHPCYPPREYRAAYDVSEIKQSAVAEWYSALVSDPSELTDENIDTLQRLYRAAIDYTGDQIGRLFEHLAKDNRLEDTLVIVTSDHGELFGDHGEYGKPERMYDELLHVPLLVANGSEYLVNASDDLVSLLDIPPLIHDTLGIDIPDKYEGRVLGKDETRRYVIAEHEIEGKVVVGARSSDWLYEADDIRDEHSLFDLRNGFERVPAEQQDSAAAEMVRQAVLDRLTTLDIDSFRFHNQVEGDVEDRLQDLGYL